MFDYIFSAESVKRYKPAPKPYRYAIKKLKCLPHRTVMIAAHGLNIQGAKAAGLRTAFITRPGQTLTPGENRPDLIVPDAHELALRLIPLKDVSAAI